MNRRFRTISDPAQGSFFDPARTPLTGAELASAIREGVADSLAAAKALGKDRYAVASEMSRLAARDVTKNMLDRYCAPSADEWRFPLELLPALVAATGDTRLVHLVTEACGFKPMPVAATAVAELVTLELEERALKKRIAAARRQLPKEALAWAAHEAERRGGK